MIGFSFPLLTSLISNQAQAEEVSPETQISSVPGSTKLSLLPDAYFASPYNLANGANHPNHRALAVRLGMGSYFGDPFKGIIYPDKWGRLTNEDGQVNYTTVNTQRSLGDLEVAGSFDLLRNPDGWLIPMPGLNRLDGRLDLALGFKAEGQFSGEKSINPSIPGYELAQPDLPSGQLHAAASILEGVFSFAVGANGSVLSPEIYATMVSNTQVDLFPKSNGQEVEGDYDMIFSNESFVHEIGWGPLISKPSLSLEGRLDVTKLINLFTENDLPFHLSLAGGYYGATTVKQVDYEMTVLGNVLVTEGGEEVIDANFTHECDESESSTGECPGMVIEGQLEEVILAPQRYKLAAYGAIPFAQNRFLKEVSLAGSWGHIAGGNAVTNAPSYEVDMEPIEGAQVIATVGPEVTNNTRVAHNDWTVGAGADFHILNQKPGTTLLSTNIAYGQNGTGVPEDHSLIVGSPTHHINAQVSLTFDGPHTNRITTIGLWGRMENQSGGSLPVSDTSQGYRVGQNLGDNNSDLNAQGFAGGVVITRQGKAK